MTTPQADVRTPGVEFPVPRTTSLSTPAKTGRSEILATAFGTGHLECGRGYVTIDPDFAAVADLTTYHVFLTGYDMPVPLCVRDRTTTGFAVEAVPVAAALTGKRDTDLTGTFSWRVVAKRKDIKGERLVSVTIPPEPTLPALPNMPTPTPPRPSRAFRSPR